MAKQKVEINECYLIADKAKLMLMIDSDLKRSFKIKCLENDTNMTEVISNFMRNYAYDGSSNKKLSKRQIKRA